MATATTVATASHGADPFVNDHFSSLLSIFNLLDVLGRPQGAGLGR